MGTQGRKVVTGELSRVLKHAAAPSIPWQGLRGGTVDDWMKCPVNITGYNGNPAVPNKYFGNITTTKVTKQQKQRLPVVSTHSWRFGRATSCCCFDDRYLLFLQNHWVHLLFHPFYTTQPQPQLHSIQHFPLIPDLVPLFHGHCSLYQLSLLATDI